MLEIELTFKIFFDRSDHFKINDKLLIKYSIKHVNRKIVHNFIKKKHFYIWITF